MIKYDLEKDSINKLLVKYLAPSIMSLLVTALYVIVDGIFVGRGTGQSGLAAINIAYPIINISNALSLMVGVGGSTLMSIYSKNKRIKNLFFTYIIILVIFFYFILNIIVFLSGDKLLYFAGSSENLLPLAKTYLYTVAIGVIFIMLSTALAPVIRNNRAPALAFFSMIVGAFINIILDYIFIMKFNWGIFGAAFATVIGQAFSFLSMLLYFLSARSDLKLKFNKFKRKIFTKILSLGFSSFIVEFAVAIILIFFNKKFMYYGGEIAVSAFCIVAYIFFIFRMTYTGIAQGIQPIVSYNYGIRRVDRMEKCFKIAHIINLCLAFIFFIFVNIFPEEITKIFNSNEELVELTVHGLRLYVIAVFFLGGNLVNISYLQAKNRAKSAILISLMSSFVFLMLYINILPIFIGLDGIWLAFPISDFTTLVITILFRKKLHLIVIGGKYDKRSLC